MSDSATLEPGSNEINFSGSETNVTHKYEHRSIGYIVLTNYLIVGIVVNIALA